MSTEKKYIDWDLNAFMKGWPAEYDSRKASFLLYVPDVRDAYQVVFKSGDSVTVCRPDGTTGCGRVRLLARELDPHPDNKDRLFRDQIGEGWRIKGHDEEPKGGDEIWWISKQAWTQRPDSNYKAPFSANSTYRTRDPLPATKVDLGPEDIILGKTVVRYWSTTVKRLVTSCEPEGVGTNKEAFITWCVLRDLYDISFDHGTTWQKPEKDAKP